MEDGKQKTTKSQEIRMPIVPELYQLSESRQL